MEKLITIITPQQLQKLHNYLLDKDLIAYDTETTNLDHNTTVIGFSVAAELDTAYYVILAYWDIETKQLVETGLREDSKQIIELLSTKHLIMHNSVFDCIVTNSNFNIDLMPAVHTDTMILAHLLDENREVGLKELGALLFGEDAKKEQIEMKQSVVQNGGVLTKKLYELYKADPELIAKYGAKDTILTLRLFYTLLIDLHDQNLQDFFYEEESMPLLRGPTYDLNKTGLRVDPDKLQKLRGTLEAECMDLKAFIYKEIQAHVKDKYPGTSPRNTFNIGASKQLAWLLFFRLGNEFSSLTKGGRELCKALEIKIPYSPKAKMEFINVVKENKGRTYEESRYNPKTKKMSRPKKVGDPWNYLACGKDSLQRLQKKYVFAEKLLEYFKSLKILNTYVVGIQERMKYNIIHPSFLQHGTTSGRYSSRNPNFQNLPRSDKRVKACIIARPGKVFVGADYSQLEPRVFSSVAQDETLLLSFKEGKDFYSVVGAPIFEKTNYSLYKDDKNSFASSFPELRDISKAFALATPYGVTAFKQAKLLGKTTEECQDIMDKYFEAYPRVELMMLENHEKAKEKGVVYSLFGRPRRIPEAMDIPKIYGPGIPHSELPYTARTLLNLAMNHTVQSSAASIMNRAAIAIYKRIQAKGWTDVKIVLQVHDQLILEGPKELTDEMSQIVKDSMETTVILPGVSLKADPFASTDLAGQK